MANESTKLVQKTHSDKATKITFMVDPLPNGPITGEVHVESITIIDGEVAAREDRASFRFETAELFALPGAVAFQVALRDAIYNKLAASDAATAAAQAAPAAPIPC